jgi:urea transport system permease protein
MVAPEYWLYVLGALFIAVTLYMPQGVVGLLGSLKQRLQAGKGESS